MSPIVDQLAIVIVTSAQAGGLTKRLTHDGFYVTQVNSLGGLLDEPTVSLLIGFDKRRLPHLLGQLRHCCRRHRQLIPAQVETPPLYIQPPVVEVEIGGATIYVLDVEHFEQF
jgi:uncharacterized protein YaaQ